MNTWSEALKEAGKFYREILLILITNVLIYAERQPPLFNGVY